MFHDRTGDEAIDAVCVAPQQPYKHVTSTMMSEREMRRNAMQAGQ